MYIILNTFFNIVIFTCPTNLIYGSTARTIGFKSLIKLFKSMQQRIWNRNAPNIYSDRLCSFLQHTFRHL